MDIIFSRLSGQLLLLLSSCSFIIAGCSPGMPNLLLRHGKQFPDGSEQLQQVLRYGEDSVSTVATVRAKMSVNNATTGTRLRTPDGTLLAYTLMVPHDPIDPARLVVFLRGHDNANASWTEAQLRMASLGLPSVVLDLRGSGASTGEPTFGVDERNDVHELIQHIRSTHGLATRSVAIVARTVGAGVAVQTAATDRSGIIRAVVVEGLFPRFADMTANEGMVPEQTRATIARTLSARNIPGDSLNPAIWLKRIHDLPMLFVWGEQDDYINERQRGVTALCYEPATPDNRQVLMVAKLHHGLDRDPKLCSEQEYQSYLTQRDAFLQRYLR
jgi:pimeloyl-ACP methyl ester carboxylesterase